MTGFSAVKLSYYVCITCSCPVSRYTRYTSIKDKRLIMHTLLSEHIKKPSSIYCKAIALTGISPSQPYARVDLASGLFWSFHSL